MLVEDPYGCLWVEASHALSCSRHGHARPRYGRRPGLPGASPRPFFGTRRVCPVRTGACEPRTRRLRGRDKAYPLKESAYLIRRLTSPPGWCRRARLTTSASGQPGAEPCGSSVASRSQKPCQSIPVPVCRCGPRSTSLWFPGQCRGTGYASGLGASVTSTVSSGAAVVMRKSREPAAIRSGLPASSEAMNAAGACTRHFSTE